MPDGKVKFGGSTPGTFKNGRNTPLSTINIIPLWAIKDGDNTPGEDATINYSEDDKPQSCSNIG